MTRRQNPGPWLQLSLGHTRLILHPLMLLMPLAACRLGAPMEVWALFIHLTVHESGHLVAARLLGISVETLHIMPFGGCMDIGNPYVLAPGKLFALALAGPLGNLLAILASAALIQAGMLSPAAFTSLTVTGATLMLFNLLPALPLDGGRMLYAVLCPKLGRERAARVGAWAGRATAAALVVLALLGWRKTGTLNLSPLIASVFLLAAIPEETRALSDTRVRSLLNALRPAAGPSPMRLMAVDEGCSVGKALNGIAPDAATLFAIYRRGRIFALADDRQLLAHAADSGGDARLLELPHALHFS